MNERELINLSRGGDADAFCRLYSLYKTRLYRYAFYRLGNETDAEDAVSDCVLSAWKQIGQVREPDAFAGWLFRILSGCCARLIQQQIRRRELAGAAVRSGKVAVTAASGEAAMTVPSGGSIAAAQPAAAVPATTTDTDTWLILQEALDQLSERDRDIVLLSAVGGLTSEEIGEMHGLSSGSVRSILSRSLKKVRGYFV
ncbi:MAG: RNA polymerase sigma factor [Firmicutes bacterium]|nr:RNA polymerase sigma factor [Bacillota bacterium]